MTDKVQAFKSVWDAVADTPEEAQNLRLKSLLASAIAERIDALKISQVAAAALCGVSAPRINNAVAGKLDLFSLDSLIALCAKLGLKVELTVTLPKITANVLGHQALQVHR